MSCLSRSSWLDHPNDIWWGVQSIKLFVMQSSSLSCYLIPLGPKYPPQHLILENSQPTFLPHCERPTFTTIENNQQVGTRHITFKTISNLYAWTEHYYFQSINCISLNMSLVSAVPFDTFWYVIKKTSACTVTFSNMYYKHITAKLNSLSLLACVANWKR
jgi:hypothetical protein